MLSPVTLNDTGSPPENPDALNWAIHVVVQAMRSPRSRNVRPQQPRRVRSSRSRGPGDFTSVLYGQSTTAVSVVLDVSGLTTATTPVFDGIYSIGSGRHHGRRRSGDQGQQPEPTAGNGTTGRPSPMGYGPKPSRPADDDRHRTSPDRASTRDQPNMTRPPRRRTPDLQQPGA